VGGNELKGRFGQSEGMRMKKTISGERSVQSVSMHQMEKSKKVGGSSNRQRREEAEGE
jgi:hypothetical protein